MWSRERLESKYQFPFGGPAISVLQTAEDEARQFAHNYIGTEHLLVAYVSVGNPPVARLLGMELNKVRRSIEFIIGRGNQHAEDAEKDIDFTPRAVKVFELSVDEARRFQDRSLEPNHIMLGIVREGEGIAVGIIESLGTNLETVRAAIIRERNEHKPPKPEVPTYLDTLARIRAFFEDPNQDPEKKRHLEWVLRGAYNLTLPTPKKHDQ